MTHTLDNLTLQRYPEDRSGTLVAADAADRYLLQQLTLAPTDTSPLIINDSFGALACALHACNPHTWGDSWLAWQALQNNLLANQLEPTGIHFFNSQQLPQGTYQRVLLRIPKSLALLEQQLYQLRPLLAPGAQVMAGAMLKHLPPSAGDLLAQYIGPYQASLAWKKARLLTATLDPELTPSAPKQNSCYTLEGTPFGLENFPGVFSRERLDIGTRVLLPQIPQGAGDSHIIDLGCGNGALGIMAAWHSPQAKLTFVDESWAAVACAEHNFRQAFGQREADFQVRDGLQQWQGMPADWILCNPPFHQQQVIGDVIARRLFAGSRRALNPDGCLLVVGNRHLGYHNTLKRNFSRVEQVAAHPKFVVLAARA
ncbi:methyltransferase [Halopseudomonas salegens]|uniref:16S rRNA (Guanine1207-N2)-methyltransferase n=1 Tax=Halopseudomonas salegens TaxID=1434072 RepID=A0A1H2EFB1_9GAMM|nr:methyltransferase [Halopseudomonas salegens]SDT93724.1 16S rRNA (guanine1207-N2)-methyltransferase [Halopseudomonas salegens]